MKRADTVLTRSQTSDWVTTPRNSERFQLVRMNARTEKYSAGRVRRPATRTPMARAKVMIAARSAL
jgi:hypothetical protein